MHLETAGLGVRVSRTRAVLGFGGVAIISVEIAKIIFFVAIILFVVSAILAEVILRFEARRGRPNDRERPP
jgi:uncharacterized membrane protein YtjA (UPF0391 family)